VHICPHTWDGWNCRLASVFAAQADAISATKPVSRRLRLGSASQSGPCVVRSSIRLRYGLFGRCKAVLVRRAALTAMLDPDNASRKPWIGDCKQPRDRSTSKTAAVCTAFSSRSTDCSRYPSTLRIPARVGSVAFRRHVTFGTSLTGFIAISTVCHTSSVADSGSPGRAHFLSPGLRAYNVSEHCSDRTVRPFQAESPNRRRVAPRTTLGLAVLLPRKLHRTPLGRPDSTSSYRTIFRLTLTTTSAAMISSLPSTDDRYNRGVGR